MDAKDRTILFELSCNARIPIKELAKKIRMSESSTIYRIERLEKNEILLGTNTIVNAYKLGYQGFRGNITLKNCNPQIEKEILTHITNKEEFSVVGTAKHNQEIFIMSWIQSTAKFNTAIQSLKETYGEYVKNILIDTYIGATYYPRQYLGNKDAKESHVSITEKENYDELDLSILKLLAYDARKPALQIASELEKPVKTIINRIRAMEKKGIIAGYGVNINIDRIGYSYYKLDIVFSKPIKKEILQSFAKKNKYSIYIDYAINRLDFEYNVEVENQGQLNRIIDELKEMGQGIEHLEIKELHKYLKLGFLS